MRITINRKLPYPTELECFDDVKTQSLKDFYRTLSMESETILLSPFNFKKITDFFNNKENITTLNKELLERYGLTDLVSSEELFIIDFECNNQYLNGICVIHPMDILNTELANFIDHSKKDFFNLLKNSDNKDIMSQYSLCYEETIDIIELENRNSTIYLKLKANYMLDQVDFSHFDYYKKEKIYYTAKVNQYNETRVTVEKSYCLNLNKDN